LYLFILALSIVMFIYSNMYPIINMTEMIESTDNEVILEEDLIFSIARDIKAVQKILNTKMKNEDVRLEQVLDILEKLTKLKISYSKAVENKVDIAMPMWQKALYGLENGQRIKNKDMFELLLKEGFVVKLGSDIIITSKGQNIKKIIGFMKKELAK